MVDGYAVSVGDILFDAVSGRGEVTTVETNGSFIIRFGSSLIRYNEDGSIGQSVWKRLSWQDMSVLPRPKPGDKGAKELAMVVQLWDYVREVGGNNA